MRDLLDTRSVHPDDRVDFWRHAIQKTLDADCRVEPGGQGAFEASIGSVHCGALSLVEIEGTPYQTQRRGAGADGHVSVIFQLEGHGSVSDSRRTTMLSSGDVCIVPPDRDISIQRPDRFHQVLVNVKEDELKRVLPDWADHVIVKADAGRPCTKAAMALLRYLMAHRRGLQDGAREHLGSAMVSQVGSIFGSAAKEPAASTARRPSRVAAYHRQRIEQFALEHLGDSELSVATIAQALGLSVRYVHKLYAAQPQHLMQWVMVQRLRACRREISARGTRRIGDVAFAWGFSSPAHFSRAFKQHFGIRPSEL